MNAAMKGFALALCASALWTAASAQDSAPGAALNQLRGIYVSGAGGMNWVQTGDASVFLGGAFNSTVSSSADFDHNWSANGALGYAWKSLFRTEVEGSFRQNDLNSISLQPLSANQIAGRVTTWAVMANVLNDFPVNSWLSPYLGGGVGYARLKLDANCTPTVGFCRYDDEDGGFAYQVIAGASIRLTQNIQLFADYHYFGVRKVNFDATTSVDEISELKFRDHAVFLGIRVAFGKASAQANADSDAVKPQS
jgi:opacity protein-like surface antigen